MSYVHAAVSMNPSAGVIRQMADEALAASALGLNWKVWLFKGADLGPRAARLPALVRYMLLRVRFYVELARLARQAHVILLRHSPGDPFLFLASFFLRSYFTVHHTLEESELTSSPFPFARLQLILERYLGRRVIAGARGLVCLTPEIARHELARVPPRLGRSVFVHPNGILYADDSDMPADRRGDVPELIFVASYFFEWHGLDTLLDSMDESDEDGRLHLVGTLPATARSKAEADPRVLIHDQLAPSQLDPLIAQCWLGLSSFGLSRKGMTEACTLKVRDYLQSGLPIYAGHRDSALPADFAFFRNGPAQWSAIIEYARVMRTVPRATITRGPTPDRQAGVARTAPSLP